MHVCLGVFTEVCQKLKGRFLCCSQAKEDAEEAAEEGSETPEATAEAIADAAAYAAADLEEEEAPPKDELR